MSASTKNGYKSAGMAVNLVVRTRFVLIPMAVALVLLAPLLDGNPASYLRNGPPSHDLVIAFAAVMAGLGGVVLALYSRHTILVSEEVRSEGQKFWLFIALILIGLVLIAAGTVLGLLNWLAWLGVSETRTGTALGWITAILIYFVVDYVVMRRLVKLKSGS